MTQTLELETEKVKASMLPRSKWSNRFVWAAIIQGLAATLLTIPIVLPTVKPAVAMVIASGGAGTWFTVGYITYIVVGVLATGLTALFYHHFEVVLNKPYHGVATYLAWIHLVLMNVGVAAVTYILMYGGYVAGAGMLPQAVGGLGWTAAQAHPFLVQFVQPAGYAIMATAAGVLAGGLGFVVSYFRR